MLVFGVVRGWPVGSNPSKQRRFSTRTILGVLMLSHVLSPTFIPFASSLPRHSREVNTRIWTIWTFAFCFPERKPFSPSKKNSSFPFSTPLFMDHWSFLIFTTNPTVSFKLVIALKRLNSAEICRHILALIFSAHCSHKDVLYDITKKIIKFYDLNDFLWLAGSARKTSQCLTLVQVIGPEISNLVHQTLKLFSPKVTK